MELEHSHIWQDEAGQALVEYSFILVMVAVVCFAALQFIGGDVSAVFQQVANGFAGVSRCREHADTHGQTGGNAARRWSSSRWCCRCCCC